MTSPRLRPADPEDAARVGELHADSWRRHYRGAYSDSFLAGDVGADRRKVWSQRLAAADDTLTVVAEDDTGLLGFVHVVFDADERWGSLVDNLHVTHGRRRTGVGTVLLTRAAEAVAARAADGSMYLWVLEQNTAAQEFYRALGGVSVEKAAVSPPGGVASRLDGSPAKLRMSWATASSLARAAEPDHRKTAGRRGDMFVSADLDPRAGAPSTGDERAMLIGFLAAQRATLQLKCAGIEPQLARRSAAPSTLSLLGLVRHLADVERRWFRQVLAGHPAPPRYSSPADPDGDFDVTEAAPALVAEAWQAWHTEVAFADTFVTEAPHLDVEGDDAWRGRVSLRWVLIHLVEEYARHNGHADLLRERIDGAIGL